MRCCSSSNQVAILTYTPSSQVVSRWQASATWRRLSQLKTLFREPRSASEMDKARPLITCRLCAEHVLITYALRADCALIAR